MWISEPTGKHVGMDAQCDGTNARKIWDTKMILKKNLTTLVKGGNKLVVTNFELRSQIGVLFGRLMIYSKGK